MKKTILLNLLILSICLLIVSCSNDKKTNPDTESPTVIITYPPNNSSFASGTIMNIVAEADDNEEVDNVEFFINGVNFYEDSTEPFGYSWNTNNLSGFYTIYAKAADSSENNSTSDIVTVTISDEIEAPILYYPFNGNAHDESGNGYDGIVNNAILVSDRFGNENSAYEFNGETSFIDCGDILNDLEVPFTVSAWINSFSNDRGQLLFFTDVHESFSSHNYYGMGLAHSIYEGNGVTLLESTQLSVRYGDGLGIGYQYRRTKNSSSFLPINEWIHVTGVVEGPLDMKLYINGVEDGGIHSGGGGDIAHCSWHAYVGVVFHGLIDDLRVYDIALNAEQIDLIYQE